MSRLPYFSLPTKSFVDDIPQHPSGTGMGVVLHEAEAAGIFITAIQASPRIEKNETNKALNPGKRNMPSPKITANIAPENGPSQKERIVFQASIFGCENVSFREGISKKICWLPVSRVISKARCLYIYILYIYTYIYIHRV